MSSPDYSEFPKVLQESLATSGAPRRRAVAVLNSAFDLRTAVLESIGTQLEQANGSDYAFRASLNGGANAVIGVAGLVVGGIGAIELVDSTRLPPAVAISGAVLGTVAMVGGGFVSHTTLDAGPVPANVASAAERYAKAFGAWRNNDAPVIDPSVAGEIARCVALAPDLTKELVKPPDVGRYDL